MESYFKLKLYGLMVSVMLSTLLIIFLAICYTVALIKEKRIEKFFVSHGYKRELFGVPSVGNGAFYGWVRESDNKMADDRDIRHLSLGEIKVKYK